MGDVKNLIAEDLFFDEYFWTMDSFPDFWGNRENSAIQVRPILHQSKNFYWEKAYLEYLKHRTMQDKAANVAEVTMDVVYTVCNAFNAIAPAIKQVLQFTPFVGILWNLIDTFGALILAIRDESKQDFWSQGINLLSGLQLSAGTAAFTLLNYSNALHISLSILAAWASVIAVSASGFAFAAAMYFAWGLEHREVKLHHARISYLEIKIQELEKLLFYKAIDKNNATVYGMSDYPGSQGDKITYLQDLIANTQLTESEVTGYKELLNLLNFHQHQLQQLEVHERARRAWGFCAVFMTAVAIVSVAVTALGLSALTCGIVVAIASCAALLGSVLYRHKPEIFDNTFKTIKNNTHRFFKLQPTAHHQVANFIPTHNHPRPAGL